MGLPLPLSQLLPTLLLSPLLPTLPLWLSPMLPLLLLPMLPLSLLWPQLLPLLSTTSLPWLLSPLPPSTRLCRPTSFPRPVWSDTRFTIRFITSPRLLWTPGPPPTPPTTSSTTPLSSEPTVLLDMVLLEPVLLLIKESNSYKRATKELLPCCRNINNSNHEFASLLMSSHSIGCIYL